MAQSFWKRVVDHLMRRRRSPSRRICCAKAVACNLPGAADLLEQKKLLVRFRALGAGCLGFAASGRIFSRQHPVRCDLANLRDLELNGEFDRREYSVIRLAQRGGADGGGTVLRHEHAVCRIETERRFRVGAVQRGLVVLQDRGYSGFVGIHQLALAVNNSVEQHWPRPADATSGQNRENLSRFWKCRPTPFVDRFAEAPTAPSEVVVQ